jgi:hypothetical protein
MGINIAILSIMAVLVLNYYNVVGVDPGDNDSLL